jgi:hypothetical protein
MSRLPKNISRELLSEARQWDAAVQQEQPEKTKQLLEEADVFKASRPPRQPVSIRLDPLDISMTKRLARRKGIPHSQLMALWIHERIDREKSELMNDPG